MNICFLSIFLLAQYWGEVTQECKGCRKYETLTLTEEKNYLRETIRAQLSVKRLFTVKSFSRKEIKEKKRGLLKPEVNFFLNFSSLVAKIYNRHGNRTLLFHPDTFFFFFPEVFQSRPRTESLSYYLEG